MFEKFEQIRQWSESHTSYELCSLPINIINELLLNFNGSIEKTYFNPYNYKTDLWSVYELSKSSKFNYFKA